MKYEYKLLYFFQSFRIFPFIFFDKINVKKKKGKKWDILKGYLKKVRMKIFQSYSKLKIVLILKLIDLIIFKIKKNLIQVFHLKVPAFLF